MDNRAQAPLPLSQGLAYSLPVMVTVFLLYPVQILLAGMYAKYFGLELTTIATIVLAARFFDAVSDPLVGYFSDRSRVKTGSRKPWVVVGCLFLVLSSYYLLVPPKDVSALYFLVWYFAFYLSWTLVDIPHYAWGGEIANSSAEKARIYSLRTMFAFIGSLLFSLIPMLPVFEGAGFTPDTLRWSVIVCGLVIVPMLWISVSVAPNGKKIDQTHPAIFKLIVQSVVGNKPLRLLLTAYSFVGLSFGMWIALIYIFVDSYMGFGKQLPLIFVLSTSAGLVAVALVIRLTGVLENKSICSLAALISVVSMFGLSFLSPGENSFLILTVLSCLFYFGNSIFNIMFPAMLSEIVDYGTWKFGADRGAMYFSVYFFLVKTTVGLGSAFGLWLVAWFGFDATATSHGESEVTGLFLAIAYLPALALCVTLALVLITPLSERRHRAISKRLALRFLNEKTPLAGVNETMPRNIDTDLRGVK